MKFTPEMVVGLIMVFGLAQMGILLILKKLGVIKFGINPYPNSFYNSFVKLRDEHIACVPMVKRHEKQLDEGKGIFTQIRDDINEMKTSLALIKQKLEIKDD